VAAVLGGKSACPCKIAWLNSLLIGGNLIDRSGHIAYAHVDADYRNRPEPSAPRRVLHRRAGAPVPIHAFVDPTRLGSKRSSEKIGVDRALRSRGRGVHPLLRHRDHDRLDREGLVGLVKHAVQQLAD
jgi:hypothetical protein